MTAYSTQPNPASSTPDDWDWSFGDKPGSSKKSRLGLTVASLAFLALAILCAAAYVIARLIFPGALSGVVPASASSATPEQAASNDTPRSARLSIDPAGGSANTPVTATGQGWWAGEPVFIFLRAPDEAGGGYSYAATVADDSGNFQATFTFPDESRWQGQAWAEVIARGTRSGLEALARFELPALTATSVPASPTAVPTSLPSATPLPTLTPLPSATAIPPTATDVPTAIPTSTPTPTASPTEPPPPTPSPQPTSTPTSTPTQPPVPTKDVTPTATPPPAETWRAEYYANPDLKHKPVLVREDAAPNFSWGEGSPAEGIPADYFSARWTRQLWLPAGTYELSVYADDGVRVWMDEALLVDEWHAAQGAPYVVQIDVPEGEYQFVVEYFEATENAEIHFALHEVANP